MSTCTTEKWTLKDLAEALNSNEHSQKKLVVPMFQRGKRWSKKQQATFIDSVKNGFPVGTMLFYKKIENNIETYLLVDGLQRSTCIRSYINNPTNFVSLDNIPDQLCQEILALLSLEMDFTEVVKNELLAFIIDQNSFTNVQFIGFSTRLHDKLQVDINLSQAQEIADLLSNYYHGIQSTYDSIASSDMPIIVYSGSEDNLPMIFDRINSQGSPLSMYEVYAASWPIDVRYEINSENVVGYVVKKYQSFIDDNFVIDGYNRDTLLSSRKLNAFEYMFGLSKYLVNKYSLLAFNKNQEDDINNTLGFELVDACLHDKNKISTLYKDFETLDVNKLQSTIEDSIVFVQNAVSVITKFKGNNRWEEKILHSKFQIMSMIATAFRAKFNLSEGFTINSNWSSIKDDLCKKLLLYYIYDIIDNYWSDGGTVKIYKVIKDKRYYQPIDSKAWDGVLSRYFDRSMQRVEQIRIASPSSEDMVILNNIYRMSFTANDQISQDKFDIEHIATKEQMKTFIRKSQSDGLPISSIANLCFLPEGVNRTKGSKNFYQDTNYLSIINLADVESKFSFTKAEDLTWMDFDYTGAEKASVLRDNYFKFCRNRFKEIRTRFFESLDIELPTESLL